MTITMLPELAQGATRVAREIPPGQASAELVNALLNQTRLFLNVIRGHRDALAAELDEKGQDPIVLRNACQISLDTLDRTAETRRMLTKLLVEEEHKKELQWQEETAAQVRQTFVDWQEALNRPFPPIDLKKLEEETRADAAAKRMIRVEKFEDLFPSHPNSN